MQPIFITGTGTGVGKTIIASIVTEALTADYWKPVQAGFGEGTDTSFVRTIISNQQSVIYPEVYRLAMPASPHIAARAEHTCIDTDLICRQYRQLDSGNRPVVIEGAGGILVPLNEHQFVADLILQLNARVILVSRNYLGSINHSLLTASLCKQKGIDVIGWIFNDQYLDYEDEIVKWSGIARIASVPFGDTISEIFIQQQAERIRPLLLSLL